MPGPLLRPAELEALRRLRLRPTRRVALGGSGQHRAHGHGSSLDFDDYRPYQVGDDPRRVDRHAHQRLGRLLVKLFEAEDEVGLQVLVDASASMAFGTKGRLACRVGAALGVSALLGGDRVRIGVVGTAAGPGPALGPWLRGRAAVGPLLDRLQATADALVGLDVTRVAAGGDRSRDEDEVMAGVRALLPSSRRGPVVLVSDLLTAAAEDQLRLLGGARAGAAVLHVLGRGDLDPWLDDDPRLVDIDHGHEVDGAATVAARRRFEDRRDAWLDRLPAVASAARVGYLRLLDDDAEERLLTRLPASGVVA